MSKEFTERQLAWAYLARVAEGPCPPLQDFISEVGAIAAAGAIAHHPDLPEALERKVAARRGYDMAEHDLQTAQANGFRLITPDDDIWPKQAFAEFDLSAIWDRRTRDQSAYPPYALWVKGNVELLREPSIAVVGSRMPSTAGQEITRSTSEELAAKGYVIVSGLARGVDKIAHEGALRLGRPTIGVVACGLDRIYPSSNYQLYKEMEETGLIVSEYPPGTRPARYRFLARNRLLAAFSEAVVVTSAAWRSGALNTASWARDMGKPVMAFPHHVKDPDAAGCHRLIRDGATLVTRTEEIVEEFSPIGQLAMPLPSVEKETDRLLNRDKKVWDAVSPYFPTSLAEIAQEAGLAQDDALSILGSLARKQLLVEDQGYWIRQKE